MKRVVCAVEESALETASKDTVPVLLYGRSAATPGSTAIGGPVETEVRRLRVQVPQAAFDFLSVALAVVAADTFIRRDEAADGWCREIELTVPLVAPQAWASVVSTLERAIRFLSGDMWTIKLVPNGRPSPSPAKRGRETKLIEADSVCLFSGGLDSTIGALDLIVQGRKPVLVSHAYPRDGAKQQLIREMLPTDLPWFSANANPVSSSTNETTMRTRSLLFIALGVIVGAALSSREGGRVVDLYIPENGLIAINPPLTLRRLGALSTRTTHPHFLEQVQSVLHGLAVPVRLENPYRLVTKGQMMKACKDPVTLLNVASETVSCGKWKRLRQQCGRCVPCLIRRSAFHAAGIVDSTPYRRPVLSRVVADEAERDDLVGMMLAVGLVGMPGLRKSVMLTGPLPTNQKDRADILGTVERGLGEVAAYLRSVGVIT